jgi:hypothetical protein
LRYALLDSDDKSEDGCERRTSYLIPDNLPATQLPGIGGLHGVRLADHLRIDVA